MNLVKTSGGDAKTHLTPLDLEAINRLSRTPLTPQEVYTFSVRLCDNEVDRDQERFSTETLEQLAPMFVGKSGLFDHQWSAHGQSARIFRTEVIHEPEHLTQAGDSYCWLKGYAYMLTTPEHQDLIAQIEGGIKKEVSVGCAVKHAVCSICGAERGQSCGHQPGQVYDGVLCYTSLEQAEDAYEFSFVAVPAQPLAGVVKGHNRPSATLRELAQQNPSCTRELNRLEQEAVLGRRYLDGLRADVVRLGALSDPDLRADSLRSITEKLDEPELLELKRVYQSRAQARFPIAPQLCYDLPAEQTHKDSDGAFLI